MESNFDPYRKWLGIAPKDQPPHYYRLLGIDVFEEDADVIANAADQRMMHVRTFQVGKNSEISQRILGEISSAKLCLLNKQRKQEYDEQLRAELEASAKPPAAKPPKAQPAPAPPPVSPPEAAIGGESDAAFPDMGVAVRKAAQPTIGLPNGNPQSPDAVFPATGPPARSPSLTNRSRRKKNNATPLLIGGAAVALIGLFAIAAFSILGRSGQANLPTPPTNGAPADTPQNTTPIPQPPQPPAETFTAVLRSIPPQEATVNSRLEIQLVTEGNHGGRVGYEMLSGPRSAEVDRITGRFYWVPSWRSVGRTETVRVRLIERDTNRTLDEKSFEIRVARPSGDGPRVAEIPDQRVAAGGELRLQIEAEGEGLSYTLEQSPPGARLDPSAGRFFWRPVGIPPGETHQVTVRVRDGAGGSSRVDFRIEVADTADQVPAAGPRQGLVAEIHRGLSLRDLVATELDPELDWRWETGLGGLRRVEGPFGVSWKGNISAPRPGTYKLIFEYTGRLRLQINGEQRFISGSDDRPLRREADVELSTEPTPIQIDLLADSGPGHFRFKWRRPNEEQEELVLPDFLDPGRFLSALPADPPVPSDPPGSEPVPSTVDPDLVRRLAQGILSFGGRLRLAGSDQPITSPDSLPPGNLNVVAIEIDNNRVGDAHLEALAAFERLEQLALTSTAPTDAGIATLANLSHLTELELRTPQLTDAGLNALLQLPNLARLHLHAEQLSSRAFATLSRMPRLESILIDCDALTGRDVWQLRNLNDLKQLSLISAGLQDSDLRGLRVLNNLQTLLLNGPVGRAGLEGLAGSQIRNLALTSGALRDADLVELPKLTNLQLLRLDTGRIGDEGCGHLAACPQLVLLEIPNAGEITPAGLERLLQAPQLKAVRLGGARIPPAELEQLRSQSGVAITID